MENIHKLKQDIKGNKYQFTFFSENYKPVACILETDKNFVEVVKNEKDFRKLAIVKICQKRNWTYQEFTKYGYSKVKYKRIKG